MSENSKEDKQKTRILGSVVGAVKEAISGTSEDAEVPKEDKLETSDKSDTSVKEEEVKELESAPLSKAQLAERKQIKLLELGAAVKPDGKKRIIITLDGKNTTVQFHQVEKIVNRELDTAYNIIFRCLKQTRLELVRRRNAIKTK